MLDESFLVGGNSTKVQVPDYGEGRGGGARQKHAYRGDSPLIYLTM
jgi:hypothetical protein